MRKGNLVPLPLPAGGHRDLGWRINPAPPCLSGPPAISHAPRSWQSSLRARGLAFPCSPLPKRLSALILHGLVVFLGLRAGTRRRRFFPGLRASPHSQRRSELLVAWSF
jgi:hypothetical protein